MYNKMHSPIGTAESCTDDVLTTFQFDLPFSVVLTGLLDLYSHPCNKLQGYFRMSLTGQNNAFHNSWICPAAVEPK
jgi:hypothetical protein